MTDSYPPMQLETLRKHFDLLMRTLHIGKSGYIVSDVKLNRIYWSESLFQQRKIPIRPYFSREEAIQFIHPQDRARFEAERDRAYAENRDFEMEIRIVCGDGSIIWEKLSAHPQFDADGKASGLLTVVQDTTEFHAATATLMKQERTYRTLFNGIADSVLLLSEGRFADCNEAALEMFGCERSQLIGEEPARFSPDYQPDGQLSTRSAESRIDRALRGERQIFEWRHRRLDGSEFDAEVTLTRVQAVGAPQLFGVVRDITARKATQTELKASLDKFAGAFETSPDAVILTREGAEAGTGLILEANSAVERVFGRERSQIVGKTLLDSGITVDMADIFEIRRRFSDDGRVRDFPTKLVRPDGSVVEVEVSGARYSDGKAVLSIITIRDVTSARAAIRRAQDLNASLDASVRQFRAVTDALPVAISYLDMDGRFTFANRTVEDWFAVAPGALLGKRLTDLADEDYLALARTMRSRFLAGENQFEASIRYPDGKVRSVEFIGVPDRTADGTLQGYYTLVADISARKAADEQLRQSQKLQAIGQLTGGVAHDFNNLLGVISGSLEIALESLDSDPGSIRASLENARRAADRGSTMTRSLLAYARQQPLAPRSLDLNALVRETTELLRRTLPSSIGIEFVGGVGLWKCSADASQLQNAILNLAVNARDAMPDGGRLTIEVRNTRVDEHYAAAQTELSPGQYVMLAVSDTGTGMPPDVVARAFEPFFTTKSLGQGTGLGLSMVYGFAKQSGGHLAIYSEVGSGTTVKLYLPRSLEPHETGVPAHERVTQRSGNETVLVTEDDDDMRLIAVTMLRSLGYRVLEASTARQALEVLAGNADISLLVTDVVLAGSMNGRRLAEAALRARPELKVLYMSGYTEDAIMHQGRLDPGVHFVQKPFRKQDLAIKVRDALEA